MATELQRGGAAFQAADGTGVGIIVRDKADRELHTQDMTLNVGPQHPATHGVLRVVVTLDGPVYERARADLGDLRVVDAAGADVPYLLERVEEERLLPEQSPVIGNRVFHRGQEAQATLDFGVPTLKSQLTLSLSGDNFRRRVKVEGRARTD